MRRFSVLLGMLAIGMCVQAFAAEPDPAAKSGQPPRQRRDDAAKAVTVRASQISGMKVNNPKGENLGSVDDIVIDATSGRVRYAAVSYGGFLGFGDTLVAVPWAAFTVEKFEGRDEYNLVLNATEEQIKGATGFDKASWPDFANRQLTQDLDAHYGIERRPRRGAAVDVRVGREGVEVDVEPRPRERAR
ncbi:MAG: PRC-barrel domain-containing protein [Patescibacteria group bacterium]|nr:PRC-barrel domain-containing protein [Patescibacteria group bacterium]